jgi:hypothetical protein
MNYITKKMVIEALASLYVNRSKRDGFHYVRSILQRFGNGAITISELSPELYEAVYRAVTVETAEEFYGVALDVQPAPTAQDCAVEPVVVDDPRGSLPRPSASFTSARIRTPMVADLEARLKERAGKPRSKPTMHVDYGNPAQFGDQRDDVVHDFPAGERVR